MTRTDYAKMLDRYEPDFPLVGTVPGRNLHGATPTRVWQIEGLGDVLHPAVVHAVSQAMKPPLWRRVLAAFGLGSRELRARAHFWRLRRVCDRVWRDEQARRAAFDVVFRPPP